MDEQERETPAVVLPTLVLFIFYKSPLGATAITTSAVAIPLAMMAAEYPIKRQNRSAPALLHSITNTPGHADNDKPAFPPRAQSVRFARQRPRAAMIVAQKYCLRCC